MAASATFDSVQAYNSARDTLIQQDRSLRLDHKRPPLSVDEAAADQYVRELRAKEAKSVWGQEYEDVLHPFPGMEFLTGKAIVEKTELFKLLKKMPKGALLHCHLDATVDARVVLQLALEHPEMHVRTTAPLTKDSLASALPDFSPIFSGNAATQMSVCASAGYVAGNWVPVAQARSSFDEALGGEKGFDDWVFGGLMINASEAYITHNTIEKIWHKFLSTFAVVRGIIHYTPIFTKYLKASLLASIEDGISYVEPRIFLQEEFMRGADGELNVPHSEWLKMFDAVVQEIHAELASQGRQEEFIGARLIYSVNKVLTPEQLTWYMDDCIKLKQEFPHLMAGFDLVGPENVSTPLKTYAPKLLEFNAKVKALGLELPLILHAGETLGDGDEPDSNLYDAVLLGTKRIGHGFSLVKHPELLKLCREREILIEVCPISNEVLRLTSSMPMHPLPILVNHGVHVALCSDDPCQFGSMGLTYDFYQTIASSEITGLIMLGEMAKDSIVYSRMFDTDKTRAMDAWNRRWAAFVKELASMGRTTQA